MRIFFSLFFFAFLACNPGGSVKKVVHQDSSKMALLPLGDVDPQRVAIIAEELRAFYGMRIRVLPPMGYFKQAKLGNTSRYSASAILSLLKPVKPADCDRILGITDVDIFTSKEVKGVIYPHWGIFGLGTMPGRECIVSDFRLRKFGKKTNEFMVLVALHEVGHNLGLPHCDKHPHCLMNDAKGTAKTLFQEKKWLCGSCRKKLDRQ